MDKKKRIVAIVLALLMLATAVAGLAGVITSCG